MARQLPEEDSLTAWFGGAIRNLAAGERGMEMRSASMIEGVVEESKSKSLEEFFYDCEKGAIFLEAPRKTHLAAYCYDDLGKRLSKKLNKDLAAIADKVDKRGPRRTYQFGKMELTVETNTVSRSEPPIKKTRVQLELKGAKKSNALDDFWS
ncbi:MAG: hypothetical protein AB8H86_21740 [Polyangiales bacterium]